LPRKRSGQPLAVRPRSESRTGMDRRRAANSRTRSITFSGRLDLGDGARLGCARPGFIRRCRTLLARRTQPGNAACCQNVSIAAGQGRPGGRHPAVSPDGTRIAFAASLDGKAGLWIRDLGSLESRLRPGTEGASLAFWSPDSRSIGFFAGSKLKRTDITGASVVNLADAPVGRGGTWNKDDVILFVPALLAPSSVSRQRAARQRLSPPSAIANPAIGIHGFCRMAAISFTLLMVRPRNRTRSMSRIWNPRTRNQRLAGR